MAKRKKSRVRYDDFSYTGYSTPIQKDIDKITPFIGREMNNLIAGEEARRADSNFHGGEQYGSYTSFKSETYNLTKEFTKQFSSKDYVKQFTRTIDLIDKEFNRYTANQKKAVYRLKKAEDTILAFNATSTSTNNTKSMARLMKGMEEYIAAVGTLTGTSKNAHSSAFRNSELQEMLLQSSEMVSSYGKMIFGSGRGFKIQGEGPNFYDNWYRAAGRVQTIAAIKGASTAARHRINYGQLEAEGHDIVLLSFVAAMEHISIHDAMKDEEYRYRMDIRNTGHYDPFESGGIGDAFFRQWSRVAKKGGFDWGNEEYWDTHIEAKGVITQQQFMQWATSNLYLPEARARQIWKGIENSWQGGTRYGRKLAWEREQKRKQQEHLRRLKEEEKACEKEADEFYKLMVRWSRYGPKMFDPVQPEKRKEEEQEVTGPFRIPISYESFMKVMTALNKAVLDPLSEIAKGIQNIYTGNMSILDFINFMDAPWQAVIAVWSMLNGASALVMQSTKGIIDASMAFIMYSVGLVKGESNDEEGEIDYDRASQDTSSFLTKAVKSMMMVFELVFKAMAIGFTMLSTFISFGVSMFLDIFGMMMKLFKEIAKTSPVYEAVSNIFNLAISMFFMPFFMAFGNTLLDTVFDLLIWARDSGQEFITLYHDTFMDLSSYLQDIFEKNKDWVTQSAQVLTAYLLDVIKQIGTPLVGFILDMTDVVLNKNDKIVELMEKGVDVATSFLQNKIMEIYLYYGTLAMKFISNHKNGIMNVIKKGMRYTNIALSLIEKAIAHFFTFSVTIGAILADILAVAGYLSWNREFVSVGLKLFGMKFLPELLKQVLAKHLIKAATFGALLGAAVYLYLFGWDDIKFGHGGYIPPTPGGVLAVVAEKETEYIIPESKMHLIRGHNNMILNFDGDVYLMDNPQAEITDVVNGLSRTSYYR